MNANESMNEYEIDITKLDRAEMVAALYNATQGMFGPPAKLMTKDEAQAEIDAITSGEQGRRLYFDYLRGRCMKIHFGKDILDTRLFDRDNGRNAAAAALAPLLDCSDLNPATPCPLCKGARELDGYGGGSRTDCQKCGGTGKDNQPPEKHE